MISSQQLYVLNNPERRKESVDKFNKKLSTKLYKKEWYLRKKSLIGKMCLDCKKTIYKDSTYCQSCFQKGAKGSNWKGGITPILLSQRNSIRKWSILVRKRDGKCTICGSIENLQADHIKPFSRYPELRDQISNGRTLCAQCHYKTDTFGGRINHV